MMVPYKNVDSLAFNESSLTLTLRLSNVYNNQHFRGTKEKEIKVEFRNGLK